MSQGPIAFLSASRPASALELLASVCFLPKPLLIVCSENRGGERGVRRAAVLSRSLLFPGVFMTCSPICSSSQLTLRNKQPPKPQDVLGSGGGSRFG